MSRQIHVHLVRDAYEPGKNPASHQHHGTLTAHGWHRTGVKLEHLEAHVSNNPRSIAQHGDVHVFKNSGANAKSTHSYMVKNQMASREKAHAALHNTYQHPKHPDHVMHVAANGSYTHYTGPDSVPEGHFGSGKKLESHLNKFHGSTRDAYEPGKNPASHKRDFAHPAQTLQLHPRKSGGHELKPEGGGSVINRMTGAKTAVHVSHDPGHGHYAHDPKGNVHGVPNTEHPVYHETAEGAAKHATEAMGHNYGGLSG